MIGHQLIATLQHDFGVTGTAGQHVVARDTDGKIYAVRAVVREHHDDAVLPCTHWLEIEEM